MALEIRMTIEHTSAHLGRFTGAFLLMMIKVNRVGSECEEFS